MSSFDYQREHARLFDLYRGMTDEELEQLAATAFELTDIARQSLEYEIASRKLRVPIYRTAMERETAEHDRREIEIAARDIQRSIKLLPNAGELHEQLPREDDGFVPDDTDLAWVYAAHELDDLLLIKRNLNHVGIECFFGPEKTRDTRKFPAKFDGDMDIRVWVHQLRDAQEVLTACVPGYGAAEDPPDLDVRCPKCNSEGVIFEERDLASTGGKLTNQSKFHWRCDDCGYEWEDDGVASAEQ